MNKFKSLLPILILLTVFLIVLGCSKKILGPSDWKNGPVNVQLKISAAQMPMAIGSVTLTVTGPGIASPIVDTLVDSAGFLVGAMRVPAGLSRKFVVEVRAPGEVGYGPVIMSGMTIADIAPFIITKLDINLKPVVPLIALLPGYREITAGDYFTFDLSVFNLDTLSSAQFYISYYDSLKFTIDSVVRGSSLDSNIIVRSATGGGSITIDIGTIGNIAVTPAADRALCDDIYQKHRVGSGRAGYFQFLSIFKLRKRQLSELCHL